MRPKIPQVLVVDDEPALRRLMADVLRMNGYPVETARHGLEALELCTGAAGTPDLLVTDIMMPPHCDGVELARLLRQSNPELEVLYVSAYAGEPRVVEASREARSAFLPKPLSPLAFSQKVEKLLDGTGMAERRDAYRQRGTVLLRVEDAYRRHLIRSNLRGAGIWVLDAAHGSEALFIGRWHESPIHMVLTDAHAPGAEPEWLRLLVEQRGGFDLIFVEPEGDGEGLRLRPAWDSQTVPALWNEVRQALGRTAVGR